MSLPQLDFGSKLPNEETLFFRLEYELWPAEGKRPERQTYRFGLWREGESPVMKDVTQDFVVANLRLDEGKRWAVDRKDLNGKGAFRLIYTRIERRKRPHTPLHQPPTMQTSLF